MKNIALALIASVVLSGSALAAKNPSTVDTPRGSTGAEAHPWNAGYLHKRNSATAEMLVCSGRCLLAGIILNTGAATTGVIVRNTSTEEASGAIVLVHRFSINNSEPGNNPIRLPILLDKGIAVKLESVSAGEAATILYRDLD